MNFFTIGHNTENFISCLHVLSAKLNKDNIFFVADTIPIGPALEEYPKKIECYFFGVYFTDALVFLQNIP